MGLKVPETFVFLEGELTDAPNQLTDAPYQLMDGFFWCINSPRSVMYSERKKIRDHKGGGNPDNNVQRRPHL